MAVNGVELEVGQTWLTRDGQQARVKARIQDESDWPFVVELNHVNSYTVTCEGYALDADSPRDTDLVRLLDQPAVPQEVVDFHLAAPAAEPQDSNTVTSAQVNDWIDWHGGECPVGPSTPIEVRLRSGKVVSTTQPGDLLWSHWLRDDGSNIVAYRVVKPTLHHQRVTVDEPQAAKFFGVKPVEGVGDINSDSKGSGARYNNGKAPLELIPLSIIVPFFQPTVDSGTITAAQASALRALDALGMFQAREGSVYEVLRELGDHWEGCAEVFDYGRRKYAEWNWAKGMKWSVPIGCAARHLMAIIRGETHDPESGKPHEWHVYCNVVMLLTYASTFTEGDDRPTKGMLL